MRTHSRLLIAALVTASLLAVVAATASALRSLSVNTLTISVSGRETFASSSINIICNLTYSGTLHNVIPKRERSVLGAITAARASEGRCETNGFGRAGIIFLNVNWTILYSVFLGTLPRITGILGIIENKQILFELPLVFDCLYRGDLPFLATIEAGGNSTEIRPLRNTLNEVVKELTIGSCPAQYENQFVLPINAVRVTLL